MQEEPEVRGDHCYGDHTQGGGDGRPLVGVLVTVEQDTTYRGLLCWSGQASSLKQYVWWQLLLSALYLENGTEEIVQHHSSRTTSSDRELAQLNINRAALWCHIVS